MEVSLHCVDSQSNHIRDNLLLKWLNSNRSSSKCSQSWPIILFWFNYEWFCFTDRIHQTVEIETNTVEIEEKGIRLRLTVVDTPGFADAVDNTDW